MKLLTKHRYVAPTVTKVRLVVKESILATCNSSPDWSPRDGPVRCSSLAGCYNPPSP